MTDKIGELRRTREYTGRRLRRARNLYVRLARTHVEDNDLDKMIWLIHRMRDAGLYASMTDDASICYSIQRKMWKLDLGPGADFRSWHQWVRIHWPDACDAGVRNRNVREARRRLEHAHL